MSYTFKNIHSKAKVAVETDKYIIYHTLKSKLNFSGNYLLMKKEAETIEELEYYIADCCNRGISKDEVYKIIEKKYSLFKEKE